MLLITADNLLFDDDFLQLLVGLPELPLDWFALASSSISVSRRGLETFISALNAKRVSRISAYVRRNVQQALTLCEAGTTTDPSVSQSSSHSVNQSLSVLPVPSVEVPVLELIQEELNKKETEDLLNKLDE
jgi:hypothetical protein